MIASNMNLIPFSFRFIPISFFCHTQGIPACMSFYYLCSDKSKVPTYRRFKDLQITDGTYKVNVALMKHFHKELRAELSNFNAKLGRYLLSNQIGRNVKIQMESILRAIFYWFVQVPDNVEDAAVTKDLMSQEWLHFIGQHKNLTRSKKPYQKHLKEVLHNLNTKKVCCHGLAA